MRDEAIEEIRRARHKISEECGHDVGRVLGHYQAVEKELRASGKYRFADPPASRRAPSTAEVSSDADTRDGTNRLH